MMFHPLFAQSRLSSKIDERIELASAFCYFAGFFDATYNHVRYDEYFNSIENLNKKAKSAQLEPFFLQFPEISNSRTNHKAIISDALYWKIEDGVVLAQIDPDHKSPLQRKLTVEAYKRFISAVNEYYKYTSFSEFYHSHATLYQTAEHLYDSLVLSHYNPEIFNSLYGVDHSEIRLYISISNGDINYSIPEKKAVIMGGFCNKYGPHFEDMGLSMIYFTSLDCLYPLLNMLSGIFLHDSTIAFNETTKENTCVYYKTSMWLFDMNYHSPDDIYFSQISMLGSLLYLEQTQTASKYIDQVVLMQKREGFVWQDEMWQYTTKFTDNRNMYPHFQDFFSSITEYYRYILNYRFI